MWWWFSRKSQERERVPHVCITSKFSDCRDTSTKSWYPGFSVFYHGEQSKSFKNSQTKCRIQWSMIYVWIVFSSSSGFLSLRDQMLDNFAQLKATRLCPPRWNILQLRNIGSGFLAHKSQYIRRLILYVAHCSRYLETTVGMYMFSTLCWWSMWNYEGEVILLSFLRL